MHVCVKVVAVIVGDACGTYEAGMGGDEEENGGIVPASLPELAVGGGSWVGRGGEGFFFVRLGGRRV